MTWRTHVVGSIASVWLVTPFLPPTPDTANIGVLAALAGFAALLPDLDAAESKIKYLSLRSRSGKAGLQPFLLPSQMLHGMFGHRGLLHSLLGLALVALLVFVPLGIVLKSVSAIPALVLGYISHLALDACTKSGVPLWHPKRQRIHFLPPPLRVTAGSLAEEPIFALLALLALALLLPYLFRL